MTRAAAGKTVWISHLGLIASLWRECEQIPARFQQVPIIRNEGNISASILMQACQQLWWCYRIPRYNIRLNIILVRYISNYSFFQEINVCWANLIRGRRNFVDVHKFKSFTDTVKYQLADKPNPYDNQNLVAISRFKGYMKCILTILLIC